jgi:hypothetical protein
VAKAEEKEAPVSPIEDALKRRDAKLRKELDAKIIARAKHLTGDNKTGAE